ncbi:MAG TPA: type II toxin-antitoxin system VapC family toxin [Xanthobacteraceae bacterium]|nr:type II toxin-antitoxin system VapC family toxin [Xanthobacteraceae bacterium]
MIAIDSSAIVAIALVEPEAQLFSEIIASRRCMIGWPTVLECRMVLSGIREEAGLDVLDKLLGMPRLQTVAFDAVLYKAAADAFDRFGKGRGHPARLNFGDCMSYAVAKTKGVPLLYKGTDFAATDLAAALLP